MATNTVVRSHSAIAVGGFFTLVTAYVLLEDVFRHGAPFTTKHLMTLAVLAGTVYFGHRWWTEMAAWRLGTMLGCTVLFVAGTTVCVLMSAGRNAEVVTNKVLVANSVNTDRERTRTDRDEAKTRYLRRSRPRKRSAGPGRARSAAPSASPPRCAERTSTRPRSRCGRRSQSRSPTPISERRPS